MTCQQATELHSSYVDGELEPRDRTEIEAHLAECASCRARVESTRRLKHAIARLAGSEEPPGAVRARIEALRFGRASDSSVLKPAWMAGAALLLIAILAVVAVKNSQSPSERLAENLVSDHLRWQAEVAPAQVASEDPERVKRFFEGRIPFTPIALCLP